MAIFLASSVVHRPHFLPHSPIFPQGYPIPWILTHEARPPKYTQPSRERKSDRHDRVILPSRPVSTDENRILSEPCPVAAGRIRISFPRLDSPTCTRTLIPARSWPGLVLADSSTAVSLSLPYRGSSRRSPNRKYCAHASPLLATLLLFPHSPAISHASPRAFSVQAPQRATA